MRVTRDLDLAEECVQDAYARALTAWADSGVPLKPGAWLTTTARRRALDLLRRDQLFRRAMPELVMDETAPPVASDADDYPGRPVAVDLHLLPPGPRRGSPGGADAAAALRAVHG